LTTAWFVLPLRPTKVLFGERAFPGTWGLGIAIASLFRHITRGIFLMKIQQSGEDYLETILLLNIKNGYVRSIDIANEFGYSKPSISRAMGILKKAGYIVMEPNGNIVFTEKGRQKAMEIYERHQVITKYLITALGIDPVAAEKDACRIEHVISQKSFDRIKARINNPD